ncbi:MAG: hypothetical protein P4L74_03715 [Candidatus Doudnabacteria bacterium]|nr:hypothetical protein [Candidatus Doudnabacteria bacterium]
MPIVFVSRRLDPSNNTLYTLVMKKSAKQLGTLTNRDLDKVADVVSGLLDKGLAPVATKKDLANTESRSKKEEVEKLKIWAVKVSEKVGIKL